MSPKKSKSEGSRGQDKLQELNVEIEKDPNNPELYGNRSVIYATMENFEMAFEDTEKGIFLATQMDDLHIISELYILQANFHYTQKAFNEALDTVHLVEDVQKSMNIFPEPYFCDTRTLIIHGKLLIEKENWEEAYSMLATARRCISKEKYEGYASDVKHIESFLNKYSLKFQEAYEKDFDKIIEQLGETKVDQKEKGKCRGKKKKKSAKSSDNKIAKAAATTENENSEELVFRASGKDIEETESTTMGDLEVPLEERYASFEIKYWFSRKKRFGVYPAKFLKFVLENGELKEKTICCSLLEVSDTTAAHYQLLVSEALGEHSVRVLFIDECSIILEEVICDFRTWYTSIYTNFGGEKSDEWWHHIKNEFRNLFRGIFKSLAILYPRYSHGNWMNGIAVFNGQGKIYNTNYIGGRSHFDDMKSLLDMITFVLTKEDVSEFDNKTAKWNVQYKHSSIDSKFYLQYCSKDLAEYFGLLQSSIERKFKHFIFYVPFFWDHKERIFFMEKMHDMLWIEKNRAYRFILDYFFEQSWDWDKLVPFEGPFRKIIEYTTEKTGKKEMMKVDSIFFWRNCRHHLHNYLIESVTVDDIEDMLDRQFKICWNVFLAAWKLVIADLADININISNLEDILKLKKKLAELLRSVSPYLDSDIHFQYS